MKKPWHDFYPEGIPYDIDLTELSSLSIFNLLENSTSRFPKNIAIIDGEKNLTYLELKEVTEQFAAGLYQSGFRKGDRIALMLPNCMEYMIAFYSVQRLGGIVIQVNPMYQPHEIDYIFRDSEAQWFIGYKEQKRKLEQINLIDSLTTIFVDGDQDQEICFYDLINNETSKLPPLDINPKEDVAVLQYTGGTTGIPKGVMVTHFNIVVNLNQTFTFNSAFQKPGHIMFGVSPVFHAMGLTNMNLCILFGATFLVVKRFIVDQVLELFRKHRPTLFIGSPTMYIALLNSPSLKTDDLNSLMICHSGSAPMPIEVIRKFEASSGVRIIEGYGLSEATTAAFRNPYVGQRKIGSIGIPLPNTDARIVDIATGTKDVPLGDPGELIIKGPQVMEGYWKKPDDTKISIRNGWLHTGDIATMDVEGYFYIVGRKKEMIIAGGFNIYPVEVEEVLYQHHKVVEACVFGVPDSYRGETVKAVIVTKDRVTEEEIKDWCTKRLAKYKVPRLIEFRKELPKTTVGKILRRQLVEEEKRKEKID